MKAALSAALPMRTLAKTFLDICVCTHEYVPTYVATIPIVVTNLVSVDLPCRALRAMKDATCATTVRLKPPFGRPCTGSVMHRRI